MVDSPLTQMLSMVRMSTILITRNAETDAQWLLFEFWIYREYQNVKVYARQDCCNGRDQESKKFGHLLICLPIVGDYNQP